MRWRGEDLFLGERKVGSVFHSAFAPKGDPKPYRVDILLPGMTFKTGFESFERGQRQLEAAVETWVQSAGLYFHVS